jgi:hypothetical protein
MLERIAKREAKGLKALGILCRKIKRLQKKELERVLPQDIGTSHFYREVPDSEKEARLAYTAILTGFQLPVLEDKAKRKDGFILLDEYNDDDISSSEEDREDHLSLILYIILLEI